MRWLLFQKSFVLLCAILALVSCSEENNNDGSQSPQPQVDTKSVAINSIQSQQWCMTRVGSHLNEEIVRISFDKSDLDGSGKMKLKFDNVIKHNSDWTSYVFGEKKYEWKLVNGADSSVLSFDVPYLSLMTTGNTLGSKSYLEFTVESLSYLSAGGKTSAIFGNCSEDVSKAKVSDKSDYALYLFQQNNFIKNQDGYVPWDLKFPTRQVKGAEVYNQLWCQSDRYLSYPYANSVKVLYFADNGSIVHSRAKWSSDMDMHRQNISFKVDTDYVLQKYAIDEASGEMKIYVSEQPGKESSAKDNFNVEFRTDGEKQLMITHDELNKIYYHGGDSKPMGLSNKSVYYNCSAMKYEDEYLWKRLGKIVDQNIAEKLSRAPVSGSYGKLPFVN